MTNVLVCIKRVPDFSGEVLLTEDAQSADARFVGLHAEQPRQLCRRAGRAGRLGDRRDGDRALGR